MRIFVKTKQGQRGLALWNARRRRASKADSTGLASIVMAGVIVVLVGLISLGFALVASRAQQNTRNSQVSAAANYAAQAGINDAIAYFQKNPSQTINKCDSLLNAAPFNQSLATDTKYSCVLIYPSTASSGPSTLTYSGLQPYKSQTVKLSSSSSPQSLMFSWQATDRANNKFVPPAQGGQLFDETSWGTNKYAPMLRLSLYPVTADGSLASAKANYKTFYLYPINQGAVAQLDFAATANGSIVKAACGISFTLGNYTNANGYDCNVIVNNLTANSASYYYAQLTPLYQQTDAKIQGTNASGGSLTFLSSQTIIDVTAKSGTSVKRLQARVGDSSSSAVNSDRFPDFAIRSANSLCKRLTVNGLQVSVDQGLQVAVGPGNVDQDNPPPGGLDNSCPDVFAPKPLPTDFTISASPSSLTIPGGYSDSTTITTTINGSFNSAISLSTGRLPAKVTVAFETNPIPPPGNGTSKLVVSVASGARSGHYSFTVTGTGGGLSHSTTIALTITPKPRNCPHTDPTCLPGQTCAAYGLYCCIQHPADFACCLTPELCLPPGIPTGYNPCTGPWPPGGVVVCPPIPLPNGGPPPPLPPSPEPIPPPPPPPPPPPICQPTPGTPC